MLEKPQDHPESLLLAPWGLTSRRLSADASRVTKQTRHLAKLCGGATAFEMRRFGKGGGPPLQHSGPRTHSGIVMPGQDAEPGPSLHCPSPGLLIAPFLGCEPVCKLVGALKTGEVGVLTPRYFNWNSCLHGLQQLPRAALRQPRRN